MSDNFLTIRQTAEKLQVHWQTVRNMLKEDRLEYIKIGKSIRIKESSIEKIKTIKKDFLEIEIRFYTQKRSKIELNLLKNKARVIDQSHLIDHWYVPNQIKNLKEKDEWFDTAKGFGLRIREVDNGYSGKISTTLEVKKLFIPFKHDTCIEREIDVKGFEEADNLLNLMDFKQFLTLDKDRVVYKYNNYQIEIDDIKGYGTGISIECKTDQNRIKVLPQLMRFAKLIGLDTKKELTDKSVTYLVMQKFAKF